MVFAYAEDASSRKLLQGGLTFGTTGGTTGGTSE
jgi:hypothetical protein